MASVHEIRARRLSQRLDRLRSALADRILRSRRQTAGGRSSMTPRVEAWLRQAAEKACKAVLIGVDLEPPRSHSLERLVEVLAGAGLPTDPLRSLRLPALGRYGSRGGLTRASGGWMGSGWGPWRRVQPLPPRIGQ